MITLTVDDIIDYSGEAARPCGVICGNLYENDEFLGFYEETVFQRDGSWELECSNQSSTILEAVQRAVDVRLNGCDIDTSFIRESTIGLTIEAVEEDDKGTYAHGNFGKGSNIMGFFNVPLRLHEGAWILDRDNPREIYIDEMINGPSIFLDIQKAIDERLNSVSP
ncbi:hypothetical protein KG088_17405 [Halomonas sp. TRM85114]|uniref:hypothetical protein n=1 Tax=Halomonas jincaotanensis TaxID=2810616 RepID=UPI001BD47611|nr:hypothetical protein [Halomonas jincaotanensis]MBS9405388.1 hypothetical protein [Halomonas jincaotanensis]